MTPRAALAALWLAAALAGPRTAQAEPVRFRLDPAASEITFHATSRLMNADGRFHRFAGEVIADPGNLRDGRVSVTIEAGSLDTGIRRRDDHLRGADFFHVERYPTVTFESVAVEPAGARLTIVGRLTMRGVTREVRVPVDVEVTREVLVARGELALERSEYGISYRSFLNPIGEVVRVAFVVRGRPVSRGGS